METPSHPPFLTPLAETGPAVDRVLEAFAGAYSNGGAHYAALRATDRDAFAREMSDAGVTDRFLALALSAFASAVPELAPGLDPAAGAFTPISPFTLDGRIAQELFRGGADRRSPVSGADAKDLATDFCLTVFEDRYRDVVVLESTQPWSGYFTAAAWDITWLVVDRGRFRVHLLCATDAEEPPLTSS